MSKSTILLSILILSNTLYADISDGKEMFNEASCLKCHETTQFKAREEKVNNYKRLHKTVGACAYNNDTGWFDDELDDVVDYLNREFYHFKF